MRKIQLGLTAGVILTLLGGVALDSQAGYHLLKRVPLGGDGGWDYLRCDPVARRLYISRSTHVLVLDADELKVIADIPDTKGVHGIAIATSESKGFTSNGGDSSCTVLDLHSLKATTRIRTGIHPDAITYDPASKRVFVMNGGSHDVTVINAVTATVVGRIPLGGRPEEGTVDGAGRLFVNLEDSSKVAVFDTRTLKEIAKLSLGTGQNPTGSAIDPQHNRLFVGCRNRLMEILDAASGKAIAALPIGQGVDGVAFDPGTGLAFSTNGEGTLTVIKEASPDSFSVQEIVPTQPGARTIALDEKTHRIFTVTADFGPPPTPTSDNPHPRPTIIPGSFVLLVFGE